MRRLVLPSRWNPTSTANPSYGSGEKMFPWALTRGIEVIFIDERSWYLAVIGCSFAGRSSFLTMEIHFIRCHQVPLLVTASEKSWSKISDTSLWLCEPCETSLKEWQQASGRCILGSLMSRLCVCQDRPGCIHMVKTLFSPKLLQCDRRRVCGWQRLCLHHDVTKTKHEL